MAPIPRLRDYRGPALLSYGFRPFFLFGSLYAGLAILVWIPAFYGDLALSTAFAPRDWHVHEMLYGYLSAVVTGFLLTAVPNWTGRLPLQGKPLLALVLLWILGRFAVTSSAMIGWGLAAILDLAFLTAVVAAVAREVLKGKNWRNLKVLVGVGILLVGNVVFHVEAHVTGLAEYGTRIGIAAVMMLVMLIGGRIIPSFTRNWLARERPGRLPVPFDRFDSLSLVAAGLALAVWIAAPDHPVSGALLLVAGFLQAVRLGRWAGDRTWRDRLVLVLHVAYAFVPLGFILTGIAAFGLLPAGAGIHAWTAGAMGVMTLAVMSRASLGHTGRPLVASPSMQVLYALVVMATVTRICAAIHAEWSLVLLPLAAAAWAGAFLGFAALYWPVLTGPRATG